MGLEILCTPRFNKAENAALDKIANALHTTREKLVRKAVRIFAAQCVPTQIKTATSK